MKVIEYVGEVYLKGFCVWWMWVHAQAQRYKELCSTFGFLLVRSQLH